MSLLSGEVGLKFPQRVMTKIYKKAYILVPMHFKIEIKALSLGKLSGSILFPFSAKNAKNKHFKIKVFMLFIKKTLKSLIFNLPIK